MRISTGSSGGGSAAPDALNGRAGTEAITNGATSIDVVFADDMDSANYALNFNIKNTVDASPVMLQGVVTAKLTTGFTITFNAPADSTAYALEYIAAEFV